MNRNELIDKYLDFFKSKGHKLVPNASLIPKDDPTVLFTTAGMHPLVPYLLGLPHPLGKRLCSIQKCIRTTDINEVGDEVHHTFFEMLGNWSLGDYFKKEAIHLSFEFLTKELKIKREKLTVSCFKGDEDSPKDEESAKIWHSLGIPEERIVFLPKEDNWWGPAGLTGPCGPDTEMFYWVGHGEPKKLTTGDNKKDWVEIWNDVFMQYNKNTHSKFEPLMQKNVDTGMGIERTLAVLNGFDDNYEIELWKPIIKEIENLSGKKYKGNEKTMRIIADHIKASVFIIADGIIPSNTEQGYVLRRLIRRAVRYGRELEVKNFVRLVAEPVFKIYDSYPELKYNKQKILDEIEKEEQKFEQTLERGISQFKKSSKDKNISGKEAFLLYQSYGFPVEMIEEECKGYGIKFDRMDFDMELRKHQELSRTASAGQFKSGLADNSEATTKLHTAAHLLLAALRKVLNDESINQKGSNITPERLRMDFSFPRKLTDEEIKKVEALVNKQIKEAIPVKREEMSLAEARKSGATGIFEEKYKGIVSVYTIDNFSKEICTGPHVKNTKELGHFKIIKEESSSSGVRRIKAVVE